ncbi:hypothetical protein MCOR29_006801 [Pyricularia oryzae]|nr:hypothetical protein MCOR29_006801 [Pyricularia oryzae]KAI6319846.1 hypothetical protein MCOR30_008487 [Pyricularia oryzae]KAI6370009.1 hypothetical protein MCOR31_004812 [Pyricularia oryzae]KAI6401020.1 hypothetical protein MCOR20_008233 [Pyricularia oryzae]KAI6424050.1 hypothetical protein MCOR21_007864 [Pyricularia oryzae]
MATSREERMHERLRGGRVHQVEDISFGEFVLLDEEEPLAEPESEPLEAKGEPSSAGSDQPQEPSEKFATRPQDVSQPVSQPDQASRTDVAATSSPNDGHVTPDAADNQARSPSGSVSRPAKKASKPLEEVTESPADAPGSGHRRRVPARFSGAANQSAILQQYLSSAQRDPDHTVDSSSPAERRLRAKRLSAATRGDPVVPASSSSRKSARLLQASDDVTVDETTGADLDATGNDSEAAVNEQSLENPTVTATVTVTQSSPIARILQKTRGRGRPRISQHKVIEATSPVLEQQPQKQSAVEEETSNELSPLSSEGSQGADSSSGSAPRSEDISSNPNSGDAGEAEESLEAEETNDQDAATRLGRKRPRSDLMDASPDLSSTAEELQPKTAKRRRAAPPATSPAVQKQPANKALKPATKQMSGPGRSKSKKTAPTDDSEAEHQRGGSIQIPVQRYTRPKQGGTDNEADDDNEMMGVTIPFAGREAVNSVDVLSQICEEVTANVLRSLRNKVSEVEDTTTRRELKTKMGAVEAFREELRTNMLEHTIALDNLQTLRRRLRSAQREKRLLRDQILNVRKEREQVALRRDALRMKHEKESQKVMNRLHISSTMQDIELAVEEGRSAPELSTKEQKQSDLANLELLMLRVGDHIRPNGHGLGVLDQVKSFNAYLERAAAALQGR